MRWRTIVVYHDSQLHISTNCEPDSSYGITRMDLRVRVDDAYDVHFSFFDSTALRLLAAAINTLLANYHRDHPEPSNRRSRRTPAPALPRPIQIWPKTDIL